MINARRGPAIGGLAFLLLLTSACGPTPLLNTQPSADALVREVLTAVSRQDEGRLRALALDEGEFRRHVWPALPAARPERNVPFSYVWGDLRQKSNGRLRATLGAHGGRNYQFTSVSFSGGTTAYAGFAVHRDAVLVVRGADGIEQQLRIFGSAIEKDGAWKVFS
nr:hypothetical protein [Acidobacteriota bacterium]